MQGVGKGIKRYGNSKQSPGMLLATDRRDPIFEFDPGYPASQYRYYDGVL